jgi:hypothetical protein
VKRAQHDKQPVDAAAFDLLGIEATRRGYPSVYAFNDYDETRIDDVRSALEAAMTLGRKTIIEEQAP